MKKKYNFRKRNIKIFETDFVTQFWLETKLEKLTHIEYLNQAKNIPVVRPSSPIKIWGKLVSYDWACKQTNKQTNW